MRKLMVSVKKNLILKQDLIQEKVTPSKDPYEIYDKIVELDEGATAKFAVKIISKDEKYLNFYYNEISVLSNHSNPGIVSFFESYTTEKNVWIVTEYMNYGKLTDLIFKKKTFDEVEISKISYQILKALKYLHENEIIHRDIKSDNILLNSKGELKLCDFGFSCKFNNIEEKYLCGSPYWMSPELCAGKQFNEKVDIWALGITLLELTDGEPPYMELSTNAILKHVSKNPPPTLKNPCAWSDEFIDFLDGCLKFDPSERKSANELLNHPFVKSNVKKNFNIFTIAPSKVDQIINM
eukprot:gene5877-9705_t